MPNEQTDEQVEEVVEETPSETPETPNVEPTPADGGTPESPEPNPTEKSEAEEPSKAEVTPDPDTTPATPEAPEQKDEAPASDESSPAPAEGDTSEVAKSAVFGNWAEVGMTVSAIESLSWTLQDYIWMFLTEDKTASEKVASVDAALTDYHTLVMKVVSALATDSPSEDVKRAAEAFKATSPDAVSKSLTEKDTKVEELTKSLSETTTELETTKSSLKEKEIELEKIAARKGIVFDKFTGHEADPVDHATDEKAAKEQFANFVITGAR